MSTYLCAASQAKAKIMVVKDVEREDIEFISKVSIAAAPLCTRAAPFLCCCSNAK